MTPEEVRIHREHIQEMRHVHKDVIVRVTDSMRQSNGTLAQPEDVLLLHSVGLLESANDILREGRDPREYYITWFDYREERGHRSVRRAGFLGFAQDLTPVSYDQILPRDWGERIAARLAKQRAEFEKTLESMHELRRENLRFRELMIKYKEDLAKVARCMRDSNGTFVPLPYVQRLHELGLLEKSNRARQDVYPAEYWMVWTYYEEDGVWYAAFLGFREDFSPVTYDQRLPVEADFYHVNLLPSELAP